jgi:hypothetical protein
MKLYSPDGSSEIDAHPSKVESLLAKGWKEEAQKKSKAKVEKPVAEEVVEHVPESEKESE